MTKSIAAVFALAFVVAGCGAAAPATPTRIPPTPATATPSAPPSPSPSPTTPAGGAIYLRAWQSQALPPPSTFLNGPMLTVSDGIVIDNNVAIPLIFPGPLLILPNATPITEAGEQAIVDQARELGLLEGPTDFSGGGVPPGGITANLLLIVDGTRYELIGNPEALRMCNDRPCQVDPGTPEAFAAYWWLLQNTSAWLGPHLGPTAQYQPERLAVLVVPPAAENGGIPANEAHWPLADFADFGVALPGGQDMTCATVAGTDLDALLPVLQNANQMTVFVDSAGTRQSLNVRALVALEPSPCPDGPLG